MSTKLHGGFDQIFEIGASYLTAQARERITVADTVLAVDSPTEKITGTVHAKVHDVWLSGPAERFDASSGTWVPIAPDRRSPEAKLNVTLDLESGSTPDTQLKIARISTVVAGNPVTLDIPPDKQRLDMRAVVVVAIPFSTTPLHTRATTALSFDTAARPAVSLRLDLYDPAHSAAGGVLVWATFDEPRLKASPLVNGFLFPLADAFHLDRENDVMVPLRTKVTEQIRDAVRTTLTHTTDAAVQEPDRLLVYAADSMVKGLAIKVEPASLRVLMQIGGTGGDPELITTSLLDQRDALGVCVNGTSLLRDQMRAVIMSVFKSLDIGDFVADEPCTVHKRVLVQFGSGSNASEVILTYLQVGVDESEDLVIWFEIEVSSTIVEVELPVSLSAQRVIADGRQALSLVPTLGVAIHAELALNALPGIGQILQAVAHDKITAAAAAVKAPQPFRQPLPGSTELRVNRFSIHQDDAPRGQRTGPDIRLIGMDFGPDLGLADLTIHTEGPPPEKPPARWRDHDLVITLGSRDYPDTLDVSCSIVDSADPGKRIDGLGGTYKRGNQTIRWALSTDDAIGYLRGGGKLLVAPGTDHAAAVRVVDAPIPYLRTTRDTESSNNLANLAACPADAEAPILDLAGRPTRTVVSPTFVHWRDVLPFGDKGDEEVNQGVKVAQDEKVVRAAVELVDRTGTVLVSATPGIDATVSGAGARLIDDPAGTRNLGVRVHWWFDAYHVCRYQVRYVIVGSAA